jgi:beta-aspartyl-peptidase (threonine type)
VKTCRSRKFATVKTSVNVTATLCVATLCVATSIAERAAFAEGERPFAIAIHGGAGGRSTDSAYIAAREKSLSAALRHGVKVLESGGTCLDAVEQVIVLLEDDPLFNAGKGAVYNHIGGHELDASIMDGRDLASGAVAGVKTIKNPIKLSRLVMTKTRHILLAGDGAEQFGKELGVDLVDNHYFDSPRARKSWQRALQREKDNAGPNNAGPNNAGPKYLGTVGCVALDQHGNLAAGTSTGGLTNKKYGRVGDSPIIGAGTYANNSTCAVSCTGTGERFIERAVAFDVSARMAYKNLSVDDSVKEIVTTSLPPGAGGMIAVSHTGEISIRFNTPGMSRGKANSNGLFEVTVGK